MRELHEDDEGQQGQIEGWLEQTGAATRTMPKWSDVFGGKGEAQVFLRKAPLEMKDWRGTTYHLSNHRLQNHRAQRTMGGWEPRVKG